MDGSYIFLAGASRGVGLEIAKLLREQQQPVVALLRSPDAAPQLEAMGIKIVMGDALDAAGMELAIQAQPVSTVISTIGGLPQDGERPDYLGNKNLIDAGAKAGVQKFILVSSIGTGNSKIALSPQALETLQTVLIEKDKAEQHLINSGLTYTIVRPGGLKSESATGQGVLTENPTVAGMIHRPDVAQLVCQCLASDRANNKILAAVDRQQLFGEMQFEEFNLT